MLGHSSGSGKRIDGEYSLISLSPVALLPGDAVRLRNWRIRRVGRLRSPGIGTPRSAARVGEGPGLRGRSAFHVAATIDVKSVEMPVNRRVDSLPTRHRK